MTCLLCKELTKDQFIRNVCCDPNLEGRGKIGLKMGLSRYSTDVPMAMVRSDMGLCTGRLLNHNIWCKLLLWYVVWIVFSNHVKDNLQAIIS